MACISPVSSNQTQRAVSQDNTVRTLSEDGGVSINQPNPNGESQTDDGNKQSRRSKKSEVFPGRTKSGPQSTNVYVRIHDVIHDIQILGDVLTSKVDTPGVELTPTKTCIRHDSQFTYCTLTCESKALAKTLRNLLLKDRTRFKPLIDCSFTDFEPMEIQQQHLDMAKKELRNKVENEFNTRSEQVIRVHNQKLTDIQKKIDRAKQNLRDLYTAKNTRDEIAALEHKLEELQLQKKEFTMALDRFRQELDSLLKKNSYEREVQVLRKRFGVECCRLEKALPMYARRQEIVELVQENPVSVLLAETGSGKSTQVVQYLLDTGLADHGTIVCTQPRKVAAVSLATHVAQELASNVGKDVGYKVGSRVKTSPSTKIVYMTDHALLNECLTDPDFKAYSCVVVDEAHERSLYTDLLLSMVKRCLGRRSDLRVIVTSATIDPQVFVDYFGSQCPVKKVSGRTFPVDVVWQDAASEESEFENYVDAAVNKAIDIHNKEPPGDILVFLTSAAEIQKCCDVFQEKMKDRTDFKCFQLHGQLQADEQQKVFEPLEGNKRKIVFATNCAETSITIDGIKYVVDTGVAKELRYDAKRNIRSLNVTIISQSSAEQRKGRAGRTAPGKCYRLYSQRSFQSMDTISLPEILKTHLGHALLKLAELGVTPDMYDFVQSPSREALGVALITLQQLGALENYTITDKGRWIARLPFDPKLGLVTLYGRECGLLYDSIVLAALVSAGSGLFYRGLTSVEHERLDRAKVKFSHQGGDNFTSLEVYKAWQGVDEKQKNKWCVENSVNAKVIRGVRETVNEVCKLLKNKPDLELTYEFSMAEDTSDTLRKVLFLCNASNLCHYLGRENAGYFAAQASRQVHFHPSSALCSLATYPEWVVYDQLLKTSRDFITGITPVDDAWVEEITREQCGLDVEEVRQKRLQKFFTQPAGTHAFFAMVGPRYTKLRQLQESCVADSSVVVLEGSREAGEVRMFCTDEADSVKNLTQELKDLALTAVKQVQEEVQEVAVGSEKSGLRVVLGQGAQVTDILMPHETRKIFVIKPSENVSEEVIKQKFQTFGDISYCHQFSGGQNWGFLVFRTVAQAVEAVEATKDDEENIAQLERRHPARHNAEFKARLSWNRRRGRGFAFVSVSPAYLPRFLMMNHIYIGGSIGRVQKDRKNEDALYLTKLPTDVTEDLIKRCLLNALGEKEDALNIIDRVNVPREAGWKTDKQELKRLENQIKGRIEQDLTTSKVQVSVFPPKTEKTAMFTGEARFSDPIEGLAACRSLRASFVLNGTKMEVEPIISAILRISKCIYDACKAELEELVTNKLADMSVGASIQQQGETHYVIRLKANETEDLVQARAFLNDVIKGDVLECSNAPALGHLLTSAGRQMLKEVEKETSAYVSVDNRLRTISIHGSVEACTKVRLRINDYLNDVLAGTPTEVTLRGGSRCPGLLKALYNKYGEHLDILRCNTGLHNIQVDYRRHKLKFMGPEASIEKAKQEVEDTENTLRACHPVNTAEDEDSIDCCACFCPIEKNDLYRLEACAHPFCKDCITRQVSIAVKEHQLPIVCCHDGCDLPLARRDFNSFSRFGQLKLPALATSALAAYVLANRDKAHFCTTPDCPMVYRVTNEDNAEVFLCPECEVRTCTACHKQAHDGMTCSMLLSSKDSQEGVEAWVRADPKNRMACPGCKSPIQKDGGCNKMHCSACGAVFCWKCEKKFKSSKECYDHLVKAHGQIFDLADVLYA